MLSEIPQAKKASVKVTTEEEELKSVKSARKIPEQSGTPGQSPCLGYFKKKPGSMLQAFGY